MNPMRGAPSNAKNVKQMARAEDGQQRILEPVRDVPVLPPHPKWSLPFVKSQRAMYVMPATQKMRDIHLQPAGHLSGAVVHTKGYAIDVHILHIDLDRALIRPFRRSRSSGPDTLAQTVRHSERAWFRTGVSILLRARLKACLFRMIISVELAGDSPEESKRAAGVLTNKLHWGETRSFGDLPPGLLVGLFGTTNATLSLRLTAELVGSTTKADMKFCSLSKHDPSVTPATDWSWACNTSRATCEGVATTSESRSRHSSGSAGICRNRVLTGGRTP